MDRLVGQRIGFGTAGDCRIAAGQAADGSCTESRVRTCRRPGPLAAEQIYRSLCLFDEHTWGAADSMGLPHAIETWGQYNEKSRYAYHALGMAKLLLADRTRSAVYPGPPGCTSSTPPLFPGVDG
jgi:hypothetical protein